MYREERVTTEQAGKPAGDDTLGCCAGLSREAAERMAGLLKAVADPTRLQLLSLIRASEDGQACVCDLTVPLGLRQPTVSHHLKVLTEAGVLVKKRRGLWSFYSIDPNRLEELAALVR